MLTSGAPVTLPSLTMPALVSTPATHQVVSCVKPNDCVAMFNLDQNTLFKHRCLFLPPFFSTCACLVSCPQSTGESSKQLNEGDSELWQHAGRNSFSHTVSTNPVSSNWGFCLLERLFTRLDFFRRVRKEVSLLTYDHLTDLVMCLH